MIETKEIILRLVIGALLGGIIGFERQTHGRAAGFRTHLLVSVASVVIMLVSLEFYRFEALDVSIIRIDPARIAAGAITGVGFLGAGVIVKSGFTIQGLTTAACIWMVSAIGLAVGAGLYRESIGAFFITLSALWCLRRIEAHLPRLRYRVLAVTTRLDRPIQLEKIFQKYAFELYDVHYEIDKVNGLRNYQFSITYRDVKKLNELLKELELNESIIKIHLKG